MTIAKDQNHDSDRKIGDMRVVLENVIRCKRDGHILAAKLGGGQCVCPSSVECGDR